MKFLKLKRLAIGALAMSMAVLQPVGALPAGSPLNTVVTAEAAAAKKTPGSVTLSKIKATAYNKINISWKKTSNATNYVVYYRKAGTSKWKKLATVASGKTSYTHTASKKNPIVVGQNYNYTVKAYNSKSKKYGGYNTKGLTAKTIPSTVKLKKAALNSKKTAVTVSWNKASGCNYYYVYRKTTSDPNWKKIASVKSSLLSYTDKKPVKGETNTYTIRAYYSKTKALGSYNTKGVSVKMPGKKPVHTHSYTAKVTKAATCSADGVKTYTCTCGNSYTETIPATGKHNYAAKVTKQATCNAAGVKTYTCSGCGKSYTEAIPATGKHNYAAKITQQPTGTSTGVKTYTCTGCGKSYTETIPALNVKVSSITLNKTSIALTAKGEKVTLSATVMPADATNKNLTWVSSNNNVATVSNGVVTAVGNGSCTITASATDGSGRNASCNVSVNIPATPDTPSAENISISGGTDKIIGFRSSTVPANVNLRDITYEFKGNTGCIDIAYAGYEELNVNSSVTFTGAKTGTVQVIARHNGTVLKVWNITVTSDWPVYTAYESWKRGVEAKIWTSGMSVKQKCDALENYIKLNFKYTYTGGGSKYYAYQNMTCDCAGATDMFGDMAKDISPNLQVRYVDYRTGKMYEYTSELAANAAGHVCNAVYLDGQWIYYDAQPPVNG